MEHDTAGTGQGLDDPPRLHPASGPGTEARAFSMATLARDERQRTTRAAAADNPATVLVIEDDEKLAQLIARMLRRAGFNPVVAATGDAALKVMRDDPPRAAVVDVMIPHPDGLEVCHQFRRDGWNGPIVVISALTSPELRERAISAGADRFLAKPFRLHELVTALAHIEPRESPGHERDPPAAIASPPDGSHTDDAPVSHPLAPRVANILFDLGGDLLDRALAHQS